ncbi:MAG: NAD(P)/FAD-dependent oxidoreductase [Halobacteriota archaeon]|nr:NAD(P)/FAD-dependent oxidoreductase [Halobacteriota archaeon]
MKFDVIVVGGGPGGSIAARRCAANGLKTLLLEKKNFNRDKPCAGGLTKKVLDRFDPPEEIVDRYYSGITITLDDDSVTLDDSERLGAFVCRGKFDSMLVRDAKEAGAEVRENSKVVDLTIEDNFVKGVVVKSGGEIERIEADIVIGADGNTSTVRRKLGVFVDNPERISLWSSCHIRLTSDLIDERIGDRIEIYFGENISKSAYAWIFPKREIVTVGVGALVSEVRDDNLRLKERLNKFITSHPVASKKLEGGKILMNQGGRITCYGTSSKTYFNGAMLIGEAAGHAMTTSGEGIYYAMAGGVISSDWAKKAVSEGDFSKEFLSGYEDAWMSEMGSDLDRSVKMGKLSSALQTPVKRVIKTVKEDPRAEQFLLDSLLKKSWGLL